MLAASALLLFSVAQTGLALKFPSGGEMVYVENFKVTEASGGASLSAEAERKVRLRVREAARGRTRFDVSFDDFLVRGADSGLKDDLRSWIESPGRDQWVNERGYVERKDEPRGGRPFFGLVLPPPSATVPDRWTAKLLPPIGAESPIDFVYRLESNSATESIVNILVTGRGKSEGATLEIDGRVILGMEGEVRFGDFATKLVDEGAKTTTTIEYRFRKQ